MLSCRLMLSVSVSLNVCAALCCLVNPMNNRTVEKRHFIWQQRCNNQYTAGFYSPVPEVIRTVALGLFLCNFAALIQNIIYSIQETRVHSGAISPKCQMIQNYISSG